MKWFTNGLYKRTSLLSGGFSNDFHLAILIEAVDGIEATKILLVNPEWNQHRLPDYDQYFDTFGNPRFFFTPFTSKKEATDWIGRMGDSVESWIIIPYKMVPRSGFKLGQRKFFQISLDKS